MDIRKRVEQRLNELDPIIMQAPWNQPEVYANFLAQTYYYVRHSTRLLALASGRFDFNDSEAHYGFAEHINEERYHERLAEKDLKNLGYQLEQFPELPETKCWYQAQYYYIQNVGPHALLGGGLALETLAVHRGGWLCDQATELYSTKCSNFLRVHADEDEDHIEGAFQRLESFAPDQQELVQESMDQAFHLYGRMVQACVETATSVKKSA